MRDQVGTTIEIAKFLIQPVGVVGANNTEIRNANHTAIQLFSGKEVSDITLNQLLVGVPP